MATYNTSTDIKKSMRMTFLSKGVGQDFKPIAYSTSDGISLSKDSVDTSNKCDGDWASSLGGVKSAEINNEAFCAPIKEGIVGEAELYEAFDKDTPLHFKYAYVTVTYGEDGLATDISIDEAKEMYTGMVKITSLEMTSDNGDICKFSVSGTSQGKVSRIAPSA